MTPATRWTVADIPDQTGRRAFITGANTGLGYQTALALAGAGATVTVAVRDPQRGEAAAAAIRRVHPQAQVAVTQVDLADLDSVRRTADLWLAGGHPLALLVNNAGIMALPWAATAQGFESQVGVNHLGHFALTGLLLPALRAAADSRVVTVASSAHNMGRLRTGDSAELAGTATDYSRWGRYGDSKLANLLFMGEFARRLTAAGLTIVSAGAHPGYAATELQLRQPRLSTSRFAGLQEGLMRGLNGVLGQSAAMGALPSLFAATDPTVVNGDYIGPDGPFEARGHPRRVGMSTRARDTDLAARVWRTSEELTGVRYPFD